MPGNRRSTRLKGYDYSTEGAYFITVVCLNRAHWFGKVVTGEVILSDAGKIVEEEWLRSAELRKEISLDEYVVMPNHLHGIVVIGEPQVTAGTRKGVPRDALTRNTLTHKVTLGAKPKTLGTVIRLFKQACTSGIRDQVSKDFKWLVNYHDHIIRNQRELERIRNYIKNNPKNWNEDELHR